jgi:hypothetical protein
MVNCLFVVNRSCRYLQDGAPAHFSRAVRDVLNNIYHDRWIGRGGPTAWPPRSPDLNHLDVYLLEHLKALVDACQAIRNYPGIFERLRGSMMRRVEGCTQSHGGQLSIYYKCTLSAVTHKLNISGHMLIWTLFLWNSCQKFVRTFQLHSVYSSYFPVLHE